RAPRASDRHGRAEPARREGARLRQGQGAPLENRRPGGIARYGSMPQRGATRLYGPRHSAPWPRDRPSGRKGLAQGAHHGVSRERRRAREWRNDPEKPLAERFRKLTKADQRNSRKRTEQVLVYL